MPSISFTVATSLFVTLLLIAAGILAAFFFYRYTIPTVPRSLRVILTVLRSASLVLLLLVLLEPRVHLVRSWIQRPLLAIVADNSRSMQIVDGAASRGRIEAKILQSPSLTPRTVESERRNFSFGAHLQALPSGVSDTLPLNEDATNMSEAFRGLGRLKDDQKPAAAIVLSDGGYNDGPNPLYEAERLGIPVFTVGIGDSSEHKDLLIARIASNDVVYNGVPAPVDVTVRSSGFGGERVEVELKDGTTVVDRTSVTLSAGTREYDVPLSFTPQSPGTKKYTVAVSALSGELTSANNTRAFFVRVLKSKLSILMIAGGAHPDVASIRQTLHEQKNFSVVSYTQKNSGGFYEGSLTTAQIDSADCILLVDMPSSSTSPQTVALIRRALETRSTPLFVVAGRDISPVALASIGSPLLPYLPFTVEGALPDERLVFFAPSAAQRLNPIVSGGTTDGIEAWNDFPPVYLAPLRFRARPECVVLGTAKDHSVDTGIPLIMTRSAGRNKSLAVMGYGLWRWRLMAQDSRATSDLFARFVSASVQWLTTPEETRAVHIATSKLIYLQNEPVEFVGQVYDANARPIETARMTVVVKKADRLVETSLQSLGGGRYTGSMEGLTEGDYTVTAAADVEGTTVGSDSSRFAVGALDREFQDTRMNPDILRVIAYRTGGQFYMSDNLAGLSAVLDTARGFAPRTLQETRDIALWNWQGTLIAILALLVVEWFLRKRNGML